jgi:hypothetical protein
MAPVLQCPECGTKHPLAEVPDAGAFPCQGCGRQLKVPEMVPRGAGTGAPGPAPAVPPVNTNPTVAQPAAPQAPQATRVMPIVEHNPPAAAAAPAARQTGASAFAPVPMWMRALLWIVALPLSFIVVFLLARALGVLTTNQLTDIYLAPGSSRFWPVARLLPVVALFTAAFVQAGVIVLSRRRGRGKSRQAV